MSADQNKTLIRRFFEAHEDDPYYRHRHMVRRSLPFYLRSTLISVLGELFDTSFDTNPEQQRETLGNALDIDSAYL
jgi:hypothetical protein